MILAAGFGARMMPLTVDTPKALIPVSGRPLLLILLQKLENAGFDEIAINSHYKATALHNFIKNIRPQTSLKIYYSFEKDILNTGGGIKKMLNYFSGDDPILVHNVDILCSLNYGDIIKRHIKNGAAATLAINKRKSDRPLCFDSEMHFKGRCKSGMPQRWEPFGFCGIQVIQPSLFREISDDRFYSIDTYVEAARFGKKIIGYDIGNAYWRDVGRIEDIEKANEDVKSGKFVI